MEKITKNDIIINELNSFSTLTCCYEIEDYKLLACGDKKGRILLFDIREKKPIVKLILTNNNNNEEINNIQFNKNSIFFSTDNNIYSIDIFSNNISNKIYSNPKIRIKNSNEENEINDFLLLPDNTIIYPDLESEQFLFFMKIQMKILMKITTILMKITTKILNYTTHFQFLLLMGKNT